MAEKPPAVGTDIVTGQTITDLTGWYTPQEVANECGVSVQRVKTLTRRGKLQCIVDREGTHRYSPQEVRALKAQFDEENERIAEARDDGLDWTPEERKNAGAALEMNALARVLQMTLRPREKLDTLWTNEVARLTARVEKLEAQNDELRTLNRELVKTDKAQDAVAKALLADETRKDVALKSLLGAVDRFIHRAGKPFLDTLDEDTISKLLGVRQELGFSEPQVRALNEARARKVQLEELAKKNGNGKETAITTATSAVEKKD